MVAFSMFFLQSLYVSKELIHIVSDASYYDHGRRLKESIQTSVYECHCEDHVSIYGLLIVCCYHRYSCSRLVAYYPRIFPRFNLT